MSFPFDPNAGTPAPAPTTPNLTHYQHHLAASIVLGAAYGGLTCKNRPDGTPEWTLYFWRPDGPSMGLTCTGNPMELVQQAGDTLAPHRGDKVFLSLQELAADDPVSLLMVYEESRRALLSMIPINGHPTTWLPEHGWLLPEGMANVERGDDCSEDGEGFTLDPKEAVMAWWAFFAGKRSENERLKGTIQLMERSERRLSKEKEKLSAAVAAVLTTLRHRCIDEERSRSGYRGDRWTYLLPAIRRHERRIVATFAGCGSPRGRSIGSTG